MLRAGGLSRGGYQVAIEGSSRSTQGICRRSGTRRCSRPIGPSPRRPRCQVPSPARSSRSVGGGAQRQPRAEPGRVQGGVLLRARSVFIDFTWPIPRPARCCARYGHRDQRPHREPAVHRIRRGLGSLRQEIRLPGIARGQAVLTIVDERARKEREITRSPGWTKCRTHLVAGRQFDRVFRLAGGFNDLFVYDLTSSQLRRLTTDQFAELAPAWSPDGKPLAFSTDRFTTDLQNLVAATSVSQCSTWRRATSVRPAVSSTRRTSIRSGGGRQGALLRLRSRRHLEHLPHRDRRRDDAADELPDRRQRHHGIEPGAVGREQQARVQRVRRQRLHDLRARDPSSSQAVPAELPTNAAVLPPRRRAPARCSRCCRTTRSACHRRLPWRFPAEEYKPKLGIDYAGQPVIGVGKDPFGTYAVGGVSFVFSDMLGNHSLYTGAGHQPVRRVRRHAVYINRTHRWNWGVSVDQTPRVAQLHGR